LAEQQGLSLPEDRTQTIFQKAPKTFLKHTMWQNLFSLALNLILQVYSSCIKTAY